MTISSHIIDEMEKRGHKYLGRTTTWDIHAGISTGKNSNFYRFACELRNRGKAHGLITAMAGARGRSQHSATELLIFDVKNGDGYCELNTISNAPGGWIEQVDKTGRVL